MTEETTTAIPSPSVSAGALLRQYREAQRYKLDVLAQVLRVSPAKLEALESDRLNELPDVMFARALALAMCRQLKADATPVLALLPKRDMPYLAEKNGGRGLDFPLDRPSFLPRVTMRFLTSMQWMALILLVVAVVIGFLPEIHALLGFQQETQTPVISAPVEAVVVELPPIAASAPSADSSASNMVVTTVQPAAVTTQAASTAGVSDVK